MVLPAGEPVTASEQPDVAAVQAAPQGAAPEAGTCPFRVVHLPVYHDNAYQPMLMEAQAAQGLHVIDGGGGGNFLRTAVRDWRPDVVHVHWLHPYLLRWSVLGSWLRGTRFLMEIALLRRRGAKIIWTVHNLANHDQLHPRIELLLTRRFVRLCDAVITHGEAASELARERFQIPSSVPIESVPFPHYADRYPNTTDRSTTRAALGLTNTQFVVTFLGRVEPYKQVTELVDSFRQAAPDDACLLIAGRASDPAYAEEICRRANDDNRVRLILDFIPDDKVQLYLNAADIIACPSTGILTSSSVLLAFSFGRPVIAPSQGCIPEAVGEAGFLYDTDHDCNALVAALSRAFMARDQLPLLGVKALGIAHAASPTQVARQLVAAYIHAAQRGQSEAARNADGRSCCG